MTSGINANQIRRENLTQTVFEALADADDPLTRHEIQLETNCSKRQAGRVLLELREHGRVRQTTDENDGRIVRYELTGGTDR